MKRFLKVYLKQASFSFAQTAIFRASFFLQFGWLSIDALTKILFIGAIYTQVNNIGGWTFTDALLLVAVFGLMYDFTWTLFLSNFSNFLEDFSEGHFDFVLTKPMHPLSYLTATAFNAGSFSGSRLLILIYICIVTPIFWHVPNVLVAIMIFGLGIVAIHAIVSIICSFAFYLIDALPLYDLFFTFLEGGKYPYSIFPMGVRFVFTFIFPVFMIANFPVMVIQNMINLNIVWLVLAIAVVLEVIAYKAWDVGVKHYSSASS